jgi:hypothetical protein
MRLACRKHVEKCKGFDIDLMRFLYEMWTFNGSQILMYALAKHECSGQIRAQTHVLHV